MIDKDFLVLCMLFFVEWVIGVLIGVALLGKQDVLAIILTLLCWFVFWVYAKILRKVL